MSEMIAWVAWVIIFVGLIFNVVGCIGLVRMPNVYAGLQSAAKCVTLGTCAILVGVFVIFGVSPIGIRAIICVFFIAVTVPAAAHALARAAHRSGIHVAEGAQVIDKYEEEVIQHHEQSETR
jgi:multicomponent Na+:H+ antiporter subunit G